MYIFTIFAFRGIFTAERIINKYGFAVNAKREVLMSNKSTINRASTNAENPERKTDMAENETTGKSLNSIFQEMMEDRQKQYEQDAEQLAQSVLEAFKKDKYLTSIVVREEGNRFKICSTDTKIGYSDITRAILVDKLSSIKGGLSVSRFDDDARDLFISIDSFRKS